MLSSLHRLCVTRRVSGDGVGQQGDITVGHQPIVGVLGPGQSLSVRGRGDTRRQQCRPDPAPRLVRGDCGDDSDVRPADTTPLWSDLSDSDERPDAAHRISSAGQAQQVTNIAAAIWARIARR